MRYSFLALTLLATAACADTNVTRLYERTCAKCHGAEGEGGGAGTRTLLTGEKFESFRDRAFFDAIRNGVPDMGMEAYGSSLSEEEIWGLVVHIRELQAQALRKKHGSPTPTNGVYRSQHHAFRVETVLAGQRELDTPWSLDFLPDGRMLITNRPGTMYVIEKNHRLGPQVTGIPRSLSIGQGGLMEVAVHPDFANNGWVYLSLCDPAKSGSGGMTKIVRGKIDFAKGARWHSEQTIFEANQKYYTTAGVHFGGKIVFDGKGHVLFTVGERNTMMAVHELATPYGKVMRLNEDGSLPSDNPWPGNPAWSLGHRNPQGLVLDNQGKVWVTEHGPRGGDELNQVERGANYGWPIVSFGINYNDTPFRIPWPKPAQGITLPTFRWLPSVATSGLDVPRGPAFAKWNGDLVSGGLAGKNLDRLRIRDGQLIEREELLHGLGRIRDVVTAPDGTLYLVLNGPDSVLRLVPAD